MSSTKTPTTENPATAVASQSAGSLADAGREPTPFATIEEALATAEATGYRVDLLLSPAKIESASEEVAASEADSAPGVAAESAPMAQRDPHHKPA